MPSTAKAKTSNKGSAQAVSLVPFIQASHPLEQPAFNFTSAALGAATQTFGPFDIPSGGFLRYIDLLVTASGGVAGGGALAADAPWNVIQSISLHDVNGKPLITPVIGGYELYLINRYGGFHYAGLPEEAPDDAHTSVVSFKFLLRVPVEIDADGVGALPNLNAAETYKLSITLNTAAAVYSAAPGAAPAITVYAQSYDWSLPNVADGRGYAQQTWPPMADEDSQTTMYHSMQVHPILTGSNTRKLGRVGNVLRNIIFVARNVADARTTDMPDDFQLILDKYQLVKTRREFWHSKMSAQFRQYGYDPPDGVYVYSFMPDGPEGYEARHMWQPTMQPTDLRIEGTWGATCKKLQVITCDVAPGGK